MRTRVLEHRDWNMGTPPFGHYALSPWREKLRLLAGGPRNGSVSRILTSLVPAVFATGAPDPFDLEIFNGQRARLYPRTNLCEKRVYARPDSWDHVERQKIAQIVQEHQGKIPLVFVDAGANVGLYSLLCWEKPGRPIARCPFWPLNLTPPTGKGWPLI